MALADYITGGGLIASAVIPYELSSDISSDIRSMGQEVGAQATQLGQTASQAATFEPFAVTTGAGTTSVGPGGGFTQTLSPEGQAIQEGLLSQAVGAIPQTQVSAQDLYSQIQQMRQPGYERERLALEQRLAAQGRLGTSSMLYGGATPELMAMEEARRQQESADILSSLTQAGALTGQNIQNISGMLTGAYQPQTQALAALTPATQLANIAMSGGLGQAEALYKSGIAGLEAQTAGMTGSATVEAARVRALADALAAAFTAQNAGQVPDWLESILAPTSDAQAAVNALDGVV